MERKPPNLRDLLTRKLLVHHQIDLFFQIKVVLSQTKVENGTIKVTRAAKEKALASKKVKEREKTPLEWVKASLASKRLTILMAKLAVVKMALPRAAREARKLFKALLPAGSPSILPPVLATKQTTRA